MSNKKIAFIVGILVLLVVLIIVLASHKKTGIVDIQLQVPRYNTVSLLIDGKMQPVGTIRPRYTLDVGDHIIVVKNSGYNDFSTNFTVTESRTTTINAVMKLSGNIPEINTFNSAIKDVDIPNATINDAVYFYNRTWAICRIVTGDSNSGIMVLRYDDQTSSWKGELGPGTNFNSVEVDALPSDLMTYMHENNLTYDAQD